MTINYEVYDIDIGYKTEKQIKLFNNYVNVIFLMNYVVQDQTLTLIILIFVLL
jgi:hypothetical protein